MAEAFFVNASSNLIAELTMEILKTVLSRAAEEIKLAWNFKDDLQKLEIKLKRIHLLLRGAAENSGKSVAPNATNLLVDDWVCKVKNVAYDADDLLDELAYETLKRRLKLRNNFRGFLSLHKNPALFHYQMGRRVKQLMDSLSAIFEDAQELGIKPIDVVTGRITSSVDTVEEVQLQVQRELVTGRGLIGREQDEANLVQLLCDPANENRHLSVIAVVGMAGLGKTALSKRVFDRNEVTGHFENRIWICVSHNSEVRVILVKMLELVGEQASPGSSYQALVKELEKNLKGKRYLLVLDDVWDSISNVWESLCCALLDIGGSNGSLVLATSRSLQVAATMEIHSEDQLSTTTKKPLICQLKGLSFSDSWSLFQQRIQHKIDVDFDLEPKARRMVAKCGGVPLAIKAIGDLLRGKSLEEWKEIEESEIWNLEDKNGILPSLKLSFNYLPSAAVKTCFAYRAIFLEDAVIDKEHLIELWMAQGFLQPFDRMERIGNTYFNILLNNSLFQDVEFNKHGNVVSCKMHDIVHALAKSISGQECLILSEIDDMNSIPSDVRHLSLLPEQVLFPKLDEELCLRTLMSGYLQVEKLSKILTYARCLRVFSLVDAGLSKLPDSIGCLKHLRYLDVSENNIMKFPAALSKLYNLQILRHQCPVGRHWSTYPTLPKEFGKLVNIRQIYTNKFSFMGYSMSLSLEAKPSTMSGFYDQDKKWGWRISDISSLNNLRGSLAIWHLEHVSSREEAQKANLRGKMNIQQLDLTWSYNATCLTNCEDVLEELQPHENLNILSIWYYNGKKLPSWQLHGLVQLKIYHCRNLHQLPTSFVFPSLKVLTVWGCDSLTSFPDLKSFKALEILKIGRCPVLECLQNVELLTNLRRLEICNCSKMTSLPQGISGLGKLTELEIGPLCRELDFFPFPDIKSSPLARSLQKLCLTGWPKVKNLPDQVGHCTQLRELSLGFFSSLTTLPYWLQDLGHLEVAELVHMENLICLPTKNLMLRATGVPWFRIRPFSCPKLFMTDFERETQTRSSE